MLPAFMNALSSKVYELFPEVDGVNHLDPENDAAALAECDKVLMLGAAPIVGDRSLKTPARWQPETHQTVYRAPSVKEVMHTPGGLTKLAYGLNLYVTDAGYAPDFEFLYTRITGDTKKFRLNPAREYIVDIEVSGDISKDEPEDCDLLAVSLLWEYRGKPKIIVFDQSALANPTWLAVLIRLLTGSRSLVAHNGKFDFRWINRILGTDLYPADDTMLMHHSMFPGAGEHGLKQLAQRILGAPEWEAGIEQWLGKVKNVATKRNHYERIPQHALCRYNAQDVGWTWMLLRRFRAMLSVRPAETRAYALEMEAAHLFQEVEQTGMPIDREYGDYLTRHFTGALEQAKQDLYAVSHEGFNANSPPQVKAYFKGLGFHLASTDETSLTKLRMNGVETNFIDALLKVRSITKALSTYVTGPLSKLRNGSIFVHSVFKIHGTTTGRLSCSNPNVQNVPNDDDTAEGMPSLRRLYKAPDGWVFVGADYSQAELRVIAELADDVQMLWDLRDGAPDFFDNMLPTVWPEMDFSVLDKSARKPFRLKLKRIVYGLNYGRSAWAIAGALTIEGTPTSEEEAQAIADAYLGRYPGLQAWRAGTMDNVYADNWVTPFGRVFQQDTVAGNGRSVQNAAWAFMPQSTASDICLTAAIDLQKWLKANGFKARICATVHDAIYTLSPVEEAEAVRDATERCMVASAVKLYNRCPFPVDGHIAQEWNAA